MKPWEKIFWATFAVTGIIILIYTNRMKEKYSNPPKQITEKNAGAVRMQILVYQGCEYILFNGNLIHKGNCTNEYHIQTRRSSTN